MHSPLNDIEIRNRIVLVRVDYNLPVQGGKVTDATRLEESLPTIRALQERGARLVLLSHFGRPKGIRNTDFSLRPIAPVLSKALGTPVDFAEDCIEEPVHKALARLMPSGVLLLENTRFHQGEESNDPEFAAALAEPGDMYVHDAFSVAHRAHASTEGVIRFLPSYAGYALQKECEALSLAVEKPEHPVMGLVGGAKVSTKIALLHNLVEKMDILAIGGAMAHSFLAAQGFSVGKSLLEKEYIEEAQAIIREANRAKCQLILPHDLVVTKSFEPHAVSRIASLDDVRPDEMSLDPGPQTVQVIITALRKAKTLLWNGPLGAFEMPPFDQATYKVAEEAANLCQKGRLKTVAGGGDTVAALKGAGVKSAFTHVSTAGGAFLTWLEGKPLPGLKALENS